MTYPDLKTLPAKHTTLDTFRGYNHNLRIAPGEFYEMENLTSDHYPALSARAERSFHRQLSQNLGMIAREELCHVDGGNFYVGDVMQGNLRLEDSCNRCMRKEICKDYAPGKANCQKQMVSMGPYVVILPDRMWVNTQKTDPQTGHYDFGSMENIWSSGGKTVTLELCRIDGTPYEEVARVKPAAPADKKLWLDSTVAPCALRQWSEATEAWMTVSPTYVKVGCVEEDLATGFAVYDGVTLEGFDAVTDAYLAKRSVIWSKTDNAIVVEGILKGNMRTELPVTISRAVPEMDHVIACGNRLWGCRYGMDESGNFVNRIFCSKQGDFNNWDCYMGEATDSSVLSVGSDGPFTGAITHLDHPVFFKENMLHKVYVDRQGEHTVTDTPCRGVQKGCAKSLAIVGEDVYYKSPDGICVYDGALPKAVSGDLGPERYTDAVAAAAGGKYYICMTGKEKRSLFVYDTARKLWHRQDGDRITDLCAHDAEVYAVCAEQILGLLGAGPSKEDPVRWYAQTGDDFFNLPEGGYLTQLTAVMSIADGAQVSFSVRYDAGGQWEPVCTVSDSQKRIFHIPLQPRKCNAVALRLEGVGEAQIFSLTKTVRNVQ